ncbi:MAG: diguanylate cyclase, partial [Gammaproteobacteria bacterium]|nr:diguanylate cyclase [Gammaproteobacteria bacterium]
MAITEFEDSVVLLVEDDATIRQLMRDFLQQMGFHVIEADDGQHAIELFEEFVPDIILLSVSVSGKSACEVCEVVRSMSHGHYLPILMLAGSDNLDFVGRSYDVGATDFLIKPVNWEMLGYRLHYMLRSARNFELLQQSKKNNQTLIDGLPDTIVRLTLNGTVLSYKKGEDASMLLSRVDAVGRRLDELLPPHLAAEFVKLIVQVVKTGELAYKEFSLSSAKKKAHYEGRMVKANDYEVVCFFRNITQRKADEEEIRQLAYYDTLTGLPNRSYFYDWVNSRFESTSVETGSLSVFVLELDNFKHINDTLGHAIGDALLRRVTARIKSAVDKVCEQQADCHDDSETLVSRFG